MAYRDQDGCHNCRRVFYRYEYGGESERFCTRNAPKRPECMSVAMDECSTLHDQALYHTAYNAWEKWKTGRVVNAWGICDHYIKD